MNLGPRARFFLGAAGVFLLLGAGMRLGFLALFQSGPAQLGASFYVGLKLDLRLALLLAIPFWLLVRWRPLDPARTPAARGFWAAHYTAVATAVLVVYVADFGHYAYLQERLNAAAVRFLSNPLISAQMVWETYPVLPGALGLLLAAAGFHFVFRRLLAAAYRHPQPARSRRQAAPRVALAVALCLFGLYGKLSYYPLRWSDAFHSPDRFSSDLALNPVLFFLDTVCTDQEVAYDEAATRAAYPRVAAYLGVDTLDPQGLTYARLAPATPLGAPRPNVVVFLLESFAAHHTGVFGNPLDPSPNFDRLAREGILFTNFYTPRSGTARAVFASVTGVPDVAKSRTASRNPRIISQQTVFAAIAGYEKHYFLGGSLNWANIRGVLRNNIPDLVVHEEGSYQAPRTDVWGISDLHLFEAANEAFRQPREQPFLAVLHSSGNHRPYTIPADHRGFEWRDADAATLGRHGFGSVEEYNSFRFLDHSLGAFFAAARQEEYFENTVFLLYGDNGTAGRTDHMPAAEAQLGLGAYHAPLLIYAPGRGTGAQVRDTPCGQTDVMATVAGLTGTPTLNTTLGRNLLDPRFDDERYAFLLMLEGLDLDIGLVDRTHFLRLREDGAAATLHERASPDPERDVAGLHPAKFAAMKELAAGLYETSRWMLYRNKPERYRR